MSRNENIALLVFWLVLLAIAWLSINGILHRVSTFMLERGI